MLIRWNVKAFSQHISIQKLYTLSICVGSWDNSIKTFNDELVFHPCSLGPSRCWIARSGGSIYIYFYNLVSFVFENIIFLNFHSKTKRVTASKVTIFWGSLSKPSEFSTKFCLSSFCSLSSINLMLDASLPPAKMILITLSR